MAATITSKFRVVNAETFIRSVDVHNLYMFIGRHYPWTDDTNPPLPEDTDRITTYERWDRMLAAKKVRPADAVHMVKRIDWTSGVVYDEYDPNDEQLYNRDFFVRNSNNNVYKVLSNNNGAQSTVEPGGQSTSAFSTSDGYQWKFMYEISDSDELRFLLSNFMPVRTDPTVKAAADSGSVNPYVEPKNGHGYNAERELGAYLVGVTVRFAFDEGGALFTDNDYRVIGLVRNPTLTQIGGTQATGEVYRTTSVLVLSQVNGTFQPDEVITDQSVGSGVEGRVVEFNTSAVQKDELYYKVNIAANDFSTGDTVEGQTSGATATVDDVQGPDLREYSGDILLAEHRQPVDRADNQTEALTVVLEF